MTRVCLDTNVLVAAFVARGLCADLLALVLSEFDLVVPEVVAQELRRVLSNKFKASSEALAAVEAVLDRCEVMPQTNSPSPISVRDPDDERVLAAAAQGKADFLVTGDDAMVSRRRAPGLPLLSE